MTEDKVKRAIETLQSYEPEEGYYMAFSGGKDSVTLKALADMAGVKYEAVYRVTSVDPPELVRFIKNEHPNVTREVPRGRDGNPITMWNLIPKRLMPPTRLVRYCCSSLKETGGDGRMTLTGVRWAESSNRKQNQGLVTIIDKTVSKQFESNPNFQQTNRGGVVLVNDNAESRKEVEMCYKRNKTLLNPIIDWEDSDVWNFIRKNKIPYCSLYDEKFQRLGCIGCPMARQKGREQEFARWPKYKKAYLNAFEKMLAERNRKGKKTEWMTATDVFNWWMEYDVLPGQYNMFEDVEEENLEILERDSWV